MIQDDQKIALVTGASRGIGQAIALTLARQEIYVFGTATTEAGAQAITTHFAQAGLKGQGLVLNVTDPASIQHLMTTIETQKHTTPSILINNAGITADNLIMRMSDEEWDKVIDTNLDAVFRMTKACIKGIIKARWGRIINVTSIVGTTGNGGQVNYAASKAGIIGFTKSLAQELGSDKRDITVNAVAPGFIDTDMTHALNDEQRTRLLQKIPLGRLGQPEDIAAAVAFLVSPQANYITGQVLHINGGMYMAG